MPHLVEEFQQQAADAIAAMREAALAARLAHARAELMRHMRLTAAKVKDQPRAEAVEAVVAEWMMAWHLDRHAWPHIAREMQTFTEAFYDYVHARSDAADARVRAATAALDTALAAHRTTIADQMAWRSMCAHGWWQWVRPVPADLPGRKDRPTVPALTPGAPFWETACAPQCLGD